MNTKLVVKANPMPINRLVKFILVSLPLNFDIFFLLKINKLQKQQIYFPMRVLWLWLKIWNKICVWLMQSRKIM